MANISGVLSSGFCSRSSGLSMYLTHPVNKRSSHLGPGVNLIFSMVIEAFLDGVFHISSCGNIEGSHEILHFYSVGMQTNPSPPGEFSAIISGFYSDFEEFRRHISVVIPVNRLLKD